MKGSLSVAEAHDLTDHLEDELRAELPGTNLTITLSQRASSSISFICLCSLLVCSIGQESESLNMVSLFELLAVFLSSFGFNLIPFAGPSNLFIASNSVLVLGVSDPATLVALGFLVALGAALAKSVHYLVTFFIGKHLSERQRTRLDAEAAKVRRWAFPLLFLAAATPIPDEPVVIPLGLMKYSPLKFFLVFFIGKLLITVLGAFLGSWAKSTFSEWLSPEATVALSIALTVIVTVILLKVDVGRLSERYLKRKKPV